MATVPTTLNNLDLGSGAATATETTQQSEPTPLPEGYEPRKRDVCCGRGKRNWNHEGNVWFRGLIQANVDRYIQAPTKTDKTAVVISIVEQVRGEGAFFVKQEDDSGKWYDIGDAQAREKVGHSLRDQVTAQKKKEREGRSLSPVRTKPQPQQPQVQQNFMAPQPQLMAHQSGLLTGQPNGLIPPQLLNQQSGAMRPPDMSYSQSLASMNGLGPLALSPQVSQNMAQNMNFGYNSAAAFALQNQQLQNQQLQNQQLQNQQLQQAQLQQLQNQQLQQLQPTPIQPHHQHQMQNMYQQVSQQQQLQQNHNAMNQQLDYGYGIQTGPSLGTYSEDLEYFENNVKQTRDDAELKSRRRSRGSVEVLEKFGRRPSWRAMSISSSSAKALVNDIQDVQAEFGDDIFDDFVFDRRRSSIQPFNIQMSGLDSRRMSAMSMASALGDSFGDLDSNAGNGPNNNLPSGMQYNNNFRSSIRRSSVSWMKEVQQHLQQFDEQLEQQEGGGGGGGGGGAITGGGGGYNRRASAMQMLEALKDVDYQDDL